MSYHPTGALSAEQERAILDIEPADIRQLDTRTKVELILRRAELEVQKREAFWNALQALASAGLPIAAFLGVTSLINRSKR